MGQRFQTVFILPPVFINDGNPNNRSEKVITYHNQWLFGKGALVTNLELIKRLKEAFDKRADCGRFGETKQDFVNHHLEKSIENAIKWVGVKDLHNETRFSESQVLDYDKESEKPIEEQRCLGDVLRDEDNNNGYFIIEIDKNLNIRYAFISGKEDTDVCEYKTPKEYLKLFYSDRFLKEEGTFEAMQKIGDGYSELGFSGIHCIPEVELEDTLSVLNKWK